MEHINGWLKTTFTYQKAGFTITEMKGFFSMTFTNQFGHFVTVTTKTGSQSDLSDLMEYADNLIKAICRKEAIKK
jgi:hypothetical protein